MGNYNYYETCKSCRNCQVLQIPKGTTPKDFIKEMGKCPECECDFK